MLRIKRIGCELRVTRYEYCKKGFEALPEHAKRETGPHRNDPMPAARNGMMRCVASFHKIYKGFWPLHFSQKLVKRGD